MAQKCSLNTKTSKPKPSFFLRTEKSPQLTRRFWPKNFYSFAQEQSTMPKVFRSVCTESVMILLWNWWQSENTHSLHITGNINSRDYLISLKRLASGGVQLRVTCQRKEEEK